MCNKIEEFGWKKLLHPLYSPDIAPSDYHLFRSLQHFINGNKYSSCEAFEGECHLFRWTLNY